jgi:hypothetical protein
MTNAASTEFPATARFSRRIDSELNARWVSGIFVIIAAERDVANSLILDHGPVTARMSLE